MHALIENGVVVQVWKHGYTDTVGEIIEGENIVVGMAYNGKQFSTKKRVLSSLELAEAKTTEKREKILAVASITDQINLIADTLENIGNKVVNGGDIDTTQIQNALNVFKEIKEIKAL